ncbi:MAG: exo-alpha-sialidase [Candidatus Latescibacteria bacterium]|nr:exo-alpha-sialidase [Candidatus Latescibacterota bacterium]
MIPTATAVQAEAFEARQIYRSAQRPGYTSWVSFFPGPQGKWYLTCEEVTRPDQPLPGATYQQFHEMSLPRGYDKSPLCMEIVLLESAEGLQTWKELSRQPVRFQHSAGSFAQACTREGRFLRFMWSCYSLDPDLAANQILFSSSDQGRTWEKEPAFHHPHFASYPHRLRTLRDGTLALCLPLAARWGEGTDRPVRAALDLEAVGEMQMTLWTSADQGHTWAGPVLLYAGQQVSETDFVELPSGDLLCINNSIFACPGRQRVYREGPRFTPGPLEKLQAGKAPETVCLTDAGLLVGCMRPGTYHWSDDLGRSWKPLEGVPDRRPEMYQPWIHHLGQGRIACAGHYGGDDAPGTCDQYLSLHLFRVAAPHQPVPACLKIERHFDQTQDRYLNSYTIALSADGRPLPGREVEVWWVGRDQPGYSGWAEVPLAQRMQTGGERLLLRTDAAGQALLQLPALDHLENMNLPCEPAHYSYQLVVRFNADRADAAHLPAQLPQLEFYAEGRR